MSQHILIHPKTHMRVLSRHEIQHLTEAGSSAHELLKRCAFAVLSAGSQEDDYTNLEEGYRQFSIEVIQEDRGIALHISGAPAEAFVDGEIIRGIREQLFSVLRDILYVQEGILKTHSFDLDSSEGITNAVFHILRNADILKTDQDPNLVVCSGGHSIPRNEYEYTKEVGYHLGLRELNIGTGCGPGAMKGPMKGATIGHAKQHIRNGRYIGITEPGIIAAESPNPIVNELVILPDIEKRLEAFVRLAHGIIIFPGGPGTAEELLYILGVLSHPENSRIPFPLVITGPQEAAAYLRDIDLFIGETLGAEAQNRYELVIDDAPKVASLMKQGMERVKAYRRAHDDAFFYSWSLTIDPDFQMPFDPTHENMKALRISQGLPGHELAANLRRVFSGIVAGNVKADGVQRVRKHGPYEIHGDPAILSGVDRLLQAMVEHGRMKIRGDYKPCYRIISDQ